MALRFYFRKASNEVINFNSKSFVEKRTVLCDGILLSKGRILQGMNFLETAELDTLNLGQLGVKTKIPVLDRFSPLSYSIAQHIHWKVSNHKGIESCLRISLQHVNIIQGMSIFREIGDECIRCKIKRGKFIQASMGPLSEKQFIIAPPFYAIQIDLCGPFRVFVPGFERETRATKVKESKVWIMVAVCLVTSNINIQVCEMKDTGSMLEAIVRISCECGYPKYISCDKESSILAALREVKINLRDLQHRLYQEQGTLIEECAVGGHDQHGKVERAIKTVQDSLNDVGLRKMRVHAMGLQTLCKQVENSYNNLPLGYRYDRDHDNTEILKILTPNMLKIGRINSRAVDGPVKLSNENRRILGDIQNKFEIWYRNWCEAYIPKLMTQKKGFRNDRDLQVNDLVYYKKQDGSMSSPWIIGRIDEVFRGRDGVIRRVIIQYQNSTEEVKRDTERSVRNLIRLYSVDDPDLQADLSTLQKRINELEGTVNTLDSAAVSSQFHVVNTGGVLACGGGQPKCGCCCYSHCKVNLHNCWGSKVFSAVPDVTGSDVFPIFKVVDSTGMEEDGERDSMELDDTDVDSLTNLIMGTRLNLL